ncbi:LysM peptidoglycan-binding domain-containing protein [Prosthecobacter fluviatilis]|uniref:LysM peptidoglycan-binding domain-containing protein n=1 Tax=Prosthecobacter fluviatilis TaxID=445931 RepID=A0ABW0KMJ4_9BACT
MNHQTPLLRACLALPLLVLAACENSSHIKGLPKDLPVINLHGSPSTPPHAMGHADYPFADNGDYKTDWAAEGGQGAGMDYSSWRSSHGGSSSRSSSKKKTSAKSKSGSKSTSRKGGSYTIKSGDNLGSIARRNGTTVAKLKAANGLSSDMIRAGRTLKIP